MILKLSNFREITSPAITRLWITNKKARWKSDFGKNKHYRYFENSQCTPSYAKYHSKWIHLL